MKKIGYMALAATIAAGGNKAWPLPIIKKYFKVPKPIKKMLRMRERTPTQQ